MLLAPALIVVLVFVTAPLVSALLYSAFSWNGLARGSFIGLENFRAVLFQEPFSTWTYNALLNNVIVFVALMLFQNGTAFLIAYLLLKGMPGHRFHQVAIFVPVILSSVIIGAMWKLFLNPLFGLVNQALIAVGLESWAQPWLGQSSTALGSLIFVNMWHWIGFPALVYLAGMQRITRETFEAARLDGASDWAIMKDIVWPLVAPATTVVVILTFIGSFNWFELPYIMGGIDGASEILQARRRAPEGSAVEVETEHIGRSRRRPVDAAHHVGQLEPVERADEGEDHHHRRGGRHEGPDDPGDDGPFRCAIELRRLDGLARHALHAGEVDERRESEPMPGVHDNQAAERRFRLAEPRLRPGLQPHRDEGLVHEAEQRIEK